MALKVERDNLAVFIADKFQEWNEMRAGVLAEWLQVRQNVYATSTKTLCNARLPWSNTTHIPKIAQIHDNLHANYMAAWFPQKNWLRWEPNDEAASDTQKASAAKFYTLNKLQASGFYRTADLFGQDFIQTGNCFGRVVHKKDIVVSESGLANVRYTGPVVDRVSPYDIVFDPTAAKFESTPKIIREHWSLGGFRKYVDEVGSDELRLAYDRVVKNRTTHPSTSQREKRMFYIADGFGSIDQYYGSDIVEVLTYYGGLIDKDTLDYRPNRIVQVIDGSTVISDKEFDSWLGVDGIFHATWRERSDNLWGQGPLEALVGLQYRVNHLENLRADIFDMISTPIIKEFGEVEDFDYEPGVRISLGEDGNVEYLHPDTTALQADFQINQYLNWMEEVAGAPKTALGFRTPGEKTAFEVDTLMNAANRIFQNKASRLEMNFFEPIFNMFLEVGRRNLDTVDTVRVFDADKAIFNFMDITREDITSTGRLVPFGARHLADKSRRVQEIVQLQAAKQDPSVAPHISGKSIAKILAEEIGEPDIYGENVAVLEQMETAQMSQTAQVVSEETSEIAVESGL